MRPALAPTLQLATPKVEKFVQEKIMKYFGPNTKIDRFYECEPATSDVSNYKGEKWVDGNWGLEILTDSFNVEDIQVLDSKSNSICVDGGSITVRNGELHINIWLYARLFRH